MTKIIKSIFVYNWPQKIVALLAASIIWFLVYNAITTTRTFSNVSVRIVNLPPDKTIRGLMPNGILDRKITLSLTGKKSVIDKIEPGDFEVVLDAFSKVNPWIVTIAKRNLVSLNPDIDLIHNVTAIHQNEFVITLSNLMTAKVPVFVLPPSGEPPEGFQYLDVFPTKLTHVVSGPEQDILELQAKGLTLSFDLGKIRRDDVKEQATDDKDEISFYIPESWKKVFIPFYHDMPQEINGPEAKQLRIDFLKQDYLPLDIPLPICVFYPQEYVTVVNPKSHPLRASHEVKEEYGIFWLNGPLYVGNVSKLFLEIVKKNLELCIVALPVNHDLNKPLRNFLDFIDPHGLEDMYVQQFHFLGPHLKQKEEYLRARFRSYMRTIQLYRAPNNPLVLNAYLESSGITIAATPKTAVGHTPE